MRSHLSGVRVSVPCKGMLATLPSQSFFTARRNVRLSLFQCFSVQPSFFLPGLRKTFSLPANVPELVIRKALNGTVKLRKAGNLAVAPHTPRAPKPNPAIPPIMPPLRVSLLGSINLWKQFAGIG